MDPNTSCMRLREKSVFFFHHKYILLKKILGSRYVYILYLYIIYILCIYIYVYMYTIVYTLWDINIYIYILYWTIYTYLDCIFMHILHAYVMLLRIPTGCSLVTLAFELHSLQLQLAHSQQFVFKALSSKAI